MGQVCHSFVYPWIRYWPWMPKFWPWALTLQGISDVYIPPKCAQSLNILPLMTPHNQWWLLLPGLHYLLQCCPGHQHVYKLWQEKYNCQRTCFLANSTLWKKRWSAKGTVRMMLCSQRSYTSPNKWSHMQAKNNINYGIIIHVFKRYKNLMSCSLFT